MKWLPSWSPVLDVETERGRGQRTSQVQRAGMWFSAYSYLGCSVFRTWKESVWFVYPSVTRPGPTFYNNEWLALSNVCWTESILLSDVNVTTKRPSLSWSHISSPLGVSFLELQCLKPRIHSKENNSMLLPHRLLLSSLCLKEKDWCFLLWKTSLVSTADLAVPFCVLYILMCILWWNRIQD